MMQFLTFGATMKEILSTMTSKGQLTVPAEVRRTLGLKKGDKVAFVLKDEGEVALRVPDYPDIASLQGAGGSLSRPMSWEEMKATVSDERAEVYRAKFGAPQPK
jgi:AbrB family looped-hinge helix DNA binding protein